QRFANDSLQHSLQQVGMDGSQKLPQRWIPVALARLREGAAVPCVILGLAAGMHYTSGYALHGRAHVVDDPLADQWAALHARHGGDAGQLVTAFFADERVFPPALAAQDGFVAAVAAVYDSLGRRGLAATLADLQQLAA